LDDDERTQKQSDLQTIKFKKNFMVAMSERTPDLTGKIFEKNFGWR
jgi:hypothetical protein